MRFTSINSEIGELDRCTRDLKLVVDAYRGTVVDVAESAIFANAETPVSAGTEPGPAPADRLRALAVAASTAPPSQFPECTEQLREILHECGERTSAYVTRLEKERAGIERALLEFATSLDKVNDGSNQPIKSTVERLRTISQSPEARPLRNALRAAADSVEQGLEHLQRQHRMAVANFQCEIVSLRRLADPNGTQPLSLPNTGLLDRSAIESHLRKATPGRVWIALLRLRGFRMLGSQQQKLTSLTVTDAASQVLASFLARSRNTFPLHTVIGRWSHDEFVAVFPPPDARVSTMAFCRGILDGLSDPYTCTIEGRTHRPPIDVSACVVDTNVRETTPQVLEKVETSFLRI